MTDGSASRWDKERSRRDRAHLVAVRVLVDRYPDEYIAAFDEAIKFLDENPDVKVKQGRFVHGRA